MRLWCGPLASNFPRCRRWAIVQVCPFSPHLSPSQRANKLTNKRARAAQEVRLQREGIGERNYADFFPAHHIVQCLSSRLHTGCKFFRDTTPFTN